MGYIRGLVHGSVAGAVIGLAIAPQEGARTREQLRHSMEQIRGGYQKASETARRVAPAAETAAHAAIGLVGSLQKRVARDHQRSDADLVGSSAGTH